MKQCHLLVGVPEGAFVVAAHHTAASEGVNVISVRSAADVDVRLPNVSAGGGMAVFYHVVTVNLRLVVDGEMRVSAEQFVASAEFAEQREQCRQAR